MHVLFVWRRPPAPTFIGGAEISQRLLAEALIQEGHRVTYIGGHEHSRTGTPELAPLLARLHDLGITPQHDGADGYHYRWRAVSCLALPQRRIAAATTHLLRADPPDVVISSQEGSCELLDLVPDHVTTIGWLHSVSRVGLEVLNAQPSVALATSRFVADRCRPRLGTRVVTFYPPFTEPSVSLTDRAAEPHGVLMINPAPDKGGELVYKLAAAMPGRPFTLVEGWWPTVERPSLPNLTYLRPQWSIDRIYQQVRLLLVPSIIEEAFGRVVIEAGLHGVPAVVSDRGGLPETIGAGGFEIDPTDWRAWRDAIETLDDPDAYQRCAQAARTNARKYLRPVVRELIEANVVRPTQSPPSRVQPDPGG